MLQQKKNIDKKDYELIIIFTLEEVSDALDKLGLISKYNPETKEGDVVGGYTQPTSSRLFSRRFYF